MADNNRSKKLIGGILGGPKRANDANSPNKRKSAVSGILGALKSKTPENTDTNPDETKRKKIGLFERLPIVDGFVLPDGGVGVAQGSNIIPIGGNDTAGTVNQDSSILINVTSNQSKTAVFVNGENTFKTAPTKISFKLSDVVRDGAKVITVESEGYKSLQSYIVRVVNNPEFDVTAFDSYNNELYEKDGLLNVRPNKPIFTKASPYVFKLESYLDGTLQEFDGTLENNEIKQIDFQLTTLSKSEQPKPILPTQTLILNLDGPANSVILVKKDSTDSTKLNQGNNVIVSEQGTEFQISSANLNLYKINSLQATSAGKKPKILNAESGASVGTLIKLDADYVVDLKSEQFANAVLDSPILQLSNPDVVRKYNINTKVDYPISVNYSGPLQTITAYVGDKKYVFNDLVKPGINGAVSTVLNDNSLLVLIPGSTFTNIGNYKIRIVPSNIDGDGDALDVSLTVVDEVYVGVPDLRDITYPADLIGPDYVGTNVDFVLTYDSINTDYIKIYAGDSTTFIQEKAKGSVNLNFQTLLNLAGSSISETETDISLVLKLIPFNTSGIEAISGITEIIKINFKKGANQIPRTTVVNRIADAFISQLDEAIFQDETSKYLTHLLHLGNGDNKVITTWTGSQDSLILKLYEPISTNVQINEEVWISKLISNPIIETVTLVPEVEQLCNNLKGPNFSLVPDNGIEYQIYEDLVASGSVTSTDLINQYASTLGIDTEKLNIEYVSGSVYTFQNFINFSSAEERLNNFFYKVKLIEYYKIKYETLSANTFIPPYGGFDGGIITQDGYQTITEDGIFDIQWEIAAFNGVSQANEAKKVFGLLNELIRGMDGYEKFLYKSNNELAYPKTIYVHPITGLATYILKDTTNSNVTVWYDNLLAESKKYDKYNPNYLINNIPKFILEDYENVDFLTFLNMIGQHFDIIWSYINGLARVKKLEAEQTRGIANELVQHMLESMGWDTKRAFDSQFLWEYAFGTYKDGFQKYSMPLKDANDIVWRRILNNLPYILKHKGTGRAMKAIMACYGVPQSMLTIMEFGGPQDPTKGGSTKFTFDDRTAAIQMKASSSILLPWHVVAGTTDYPNAIEFRIKPDLIKTTRIISGSQFNLDIVPTTGSFSQLNFSIGADSSPTYFEEPFISQSVSTIYISPEASGVYALGPETVTGSLAFPLSTENYSNILINKHDYGSSTQYEILLATSDGTRLTTYVSMSLFTVGNAWETGSALSLGNTFSGSLDEVRLWRVPLQASKFQNHTLFPDAINGNSVTASTADLLFRLDFEYPKDRTITENKGIKNVAINPIYGEEFASASYMYSASMYPYQYIPYDRTVTANVPSVGFGYGNKIRFEEQTVVSDLSYKTRATKKAFDQAPIDSNRLGLFFSPIKELNMDILKAFGDFNIDNYIGDPSDEYKDTYRQLDTLREYYFERLGNRNINEYIQLVRYIDKSLFDVLADLAPARAKVSKGLLIEPHYLERSKTKWKKAESERNDYDSLINIDENNKIELSYDTKDALLDATNVTNFSFDLNNFDGLINANESYVIDGTNPNYESEIDYKFDDLLIADAPFYDVSIDCPTGETLTGEVDSFNFESIGMDRNSLANAGFGVYGNHGVGVVRTFDGLFGNTESTGSRRNIYLIKQQYTKNVSTQIKGYPTTGSLVGDRVVYADIPVINYKYAVSLLPFSGSVVNSSEIVSVTALNGYFPTHYRYGYLPEGLRRSYYKGSIQDTTTTPDGLPAVETFTTNPNILRVAKTGRGSGEPILEVD
jgi:hypothetical protein